MSGARTGISIDRIRRELSAATDPALVVRSVAESIGRDLSADVVRVVWQRDGAAERHEFRRPGRIVSHDYAVAALADGALRLGGEQITSPVIVSDLDAARLSLGVLHALNAVKSYALLPVYERGRMAGFLEVLFLDRRHRWERSHVAALVTVLDLMVVHGRGARENAGDSIEAPPVAQSLSDELKEARLLYERLIDHGNMLLIRTDGELVVTDIQGDCENLLGMSKREILNGRGLWRQFLTPPSFRRHALRIGASSRRGDRQEISEEIGVVNRRTGETRWILLKGIPLFNAQQEFCGWEGLGLDITERRRTRDEATQQTKRIEALYEVSRVLNVTMDPATVMLKGLKALVAATGSNCGLGCFYDGVSDRLELAASEGLSPSYLEAFEKVLNGRTLIRRAVEDRQGFILNDVQLDKRAAVEIAKMEGLRATIIVPLLSDGNVVGAIAIFCRRANQYNEDDFELVSAAARQIALAVRQAEFYSAQRREADSLAALYRLSHELTKHLTPIEVAAHAFPIIQEEMACRRLWLGVLNDQGTHITGQAGVGPGVRKPVIDSQIDLSMPRPHLDQALRTKEAVVLKAEDFAECAGFERVFEKLEISTLIVVPLVTLGQVVGVLLVEPVVASAAIPDRKIKLLTTMGTEIATVIMARRFESRMAESEKMRMAGVLASGVAHNFNNMLQAVMGQASLIEMQSTRESPIGSSAKMIIEAASKGAGLIKQLMSFSLQGTSARKNLSLERFFGDSLELYKSVVGSAVGLSIDVARGTPDVYADYSQIQHVVTNLLMNAREAIGERHDGSIVLRARPVTLRSGEIDREIAPGDYVRIDIEDNGAGMDAESAARCFEPFFTTKNVDARTGVGLNGSGLGLSSAYSIVKQHEGVITVRSSLGAGAVFSVYLPVSPVVPESAGAIAAVDRRTVLPLDREALIFNVEATVELALKSTVESLGMRATIVRTAEALLEAVRDWDRGIQLVVVDVDRSEQELRAIIPAVRRARDRIRILCSTADRVRWSKDLATIPGVEVVEKPLGVWTLSFHVRRALKSPLTTRLADRVEVQHEGSTAATAASTSGGPDEKTKSV